MFKKLPACLAIVLMPACLWAQTKVIHYPNGNKAFKGHGVMSWPEMEMKDIMPDLPKIEYGDYGHQNDVMRLKALLNLIPTAIYDGKCTFYRQDGQKWFSGKYRYGQKQGPFKYWYDNGQLAAIQYYRNGMSDGHWQLWDSIGRNLASYHYRAIPDSLLKEMNLYFMSSFIAGPLSTPESEKIDSVFSSFLKRELRPLLPYGLFDVYRDRMTVFEDYLENNLINKTFWNGSFEVWKEGKPYMEFAFKNNRPEGIWKLWKDDKLVFELTLNNDSVVSVKDYVNPEANQSYARFLERQTRDANTSLSSNHFDDDPNAVDPGLSPAAAGTTSQTHAGSARPESDGNKEGKTFRFVEQNAEFPGGQGALGRFIKTHLQYPKEAMKNNIQGRVAVQFVITETGKVDTNSIQVLKRVAPLIDAEAVRIIKLMPDWKPAKNNGKPVKSYFVVPMTFKL